MTDVMIPRSIKATPAQWKAWERLSLSQWEPTGFGSVVRTLLDWALKVARPSCVNSERLVLDDWDLAEIAVLLDRRKRGPAKDTAEANGVTKTPEPPEAPPKAPPEAGVTPPAKKPRAQKQPAKGVTPPAKKPAKARKGVKA